jgi:hypothetical protein
MDLQLSDSDREQLSSWMQKVGEAVNDIADNLERGTNLEEQIVLLLRLSNQLKVTASKLKYAD